MNVRIRRLIAGACLSGTLVAEWVSGGAALGKQTRGLTDFASMAVVPLENGPNQLDLDGDGRVDLVFVAWRDNANAHGFNHVTFYRSSPAVPKWSLVPFFNRDETQAFSFETFQGADCVLRDLRVLRTPSKPASPVVVVTANRPFGETFISREPVTFTVYRFARNVEGLAGRPPFFFRAAETIMSTAAYCDVGEAFKAELGF
jgi:hypothetical protein